MHPTHDAPKGLLRNVLGDLRMHRVFVFPWYFVLASLLASPVYGMAGQYLPSESGPSCTILPSGVT